jgi:hypothetical protein
MWRPLRISALKMDCHEDAIPPSVAAKLVHIGSQIVKPAAKSDDEALMAHEAL